MQRVESGVENEILERWMTRDVASPVAVSAMQSCSGAAECRCRRRGQGQAQMQGRGGACRAAARPALPAYLTLAYLSKPQM